MKKDSFEFAPINPKPFHLPSLYSDQNSKEKPKRTPCPQAVKEAVWRKYFENNMDGSCYVCKKNISFTDFEVGHNSPASRGGKWTVTNTRPLCRTCNRSMGDKMTVEAFKKKYFSTKPKSVTSKNKNTSKLKSRTSKTKK